MINLISILCTGCLAFAVLVPVPAVANPVDSFKDPTRPLNAVDNQSALDITQIPLQLSAIFMRPDAPSAVINGQTLQRGDSISGITITRIESGRVYFTGKQTGVLNLYPAVIKRKLP